MGILPTSVDTLIGIRIMVYWGLYIVNDQPSQPISDKREGDYIIIKHIPRHHKIGVSKY